LPNLTSQHWKYLFAVIVVIDLLIVGGVFYFITAADSLAESRAAVAGTPTATATITSTPWAGPGPRPTATPTLPPTPLPTTILAESGFPHGFTPTPRPTREPVIITLPQIYGVNRAKVDVPVVNQLYYPEPFFPPGTNNACGPVSLFAAMQGLGVNVDYSRLRNVAVNNGFNAEGISKWGIINTAVTLNSELGNPLALEYGNHYRTKDLTRHLRQGGVIVVLVYVKKEYGQYRLTGDRAGSIGHFLLVESVNFRSRQVKLAGSTLGMDKVPITDFIRSWTGNSQFVIPTGGWRTYLRNEPASNWALILKHSQ
jgi:hypothetical protein